MVVSKRLDFGTELGVKCAPHVIFLRSDFFPGAHYTNFRVIRVVDNIVS